MDKEYCEDCESFYVYLATLAPPGKQFTPTCTIALKSGGKFTPISEIEICTMKNKIREIKMVEIKTEPDWQYECLDCGGEGYEGKLSCGCTGYRMRRPCMACKGNGIVNIKMFKTQEETHRKKWEEKYKVT